MRGKEEGLIYHITHSHSCSLLLAHHHLRALSSVIFAELLVMDAIPYEKIRAKAGEGGSIWRQTIRKGNEYWLEVEKTSHFGSRT